MLSALAKPILEKHLFSFLDDERTALESTTLDALIGHVQDCAEQRRASPGRAFDAVLATKRRREAATFLLLQVSAFLPAMNTAIGRSSLGEYGLAHAGLRPLLSDEYRAWVAAEESYRRLLTGARLQPATAAYWQLYLNSSLARGNHLHHLSINRENFFTFLGALVYKKIDDAATAGRLSTVLAECLGTDTSYLDESPTLAGDTLTALVKQLLEPFIDVHGDRVVGDFHRGFADAHWFAELWDADLTEQITWADRIEEYQDKAEKIQKHLTDEHIDVDLDTFVESCDETSTTHVHDEHRLVMIEVGQMHFWNNVTHKIELNQGDKLLVPVSRLHGSTVLSGECTYHQPIIPDELLQKIV
jgi:hypothetical protein